MLISWLDLVSYFVETLDAADGKGRLLCPDLYRSNFRTGTFSNNCSICKFYTFLGGCAFVIGFDVLVGLALGIFGLVGIF
jgi:hypothetical protein